jgi:putative transposase
VRAHQAEYPVKLMCRLLGVSPSGYYAWRKRGASARSQADADLLEKIEHVHTRSHGTYGSPRIHAELRENGTRVARKRVARLMAEAGIEGVSRRRGVKTTLRCARTRPAPDLVERNFAATGPDRLWVADITYISTAAGFLYLAVVLDAWSRRVVGWAMAAHLRTELVLNALGMALGQRRPAAVIHPLGPGDTVYLGGVRPAVQASRSEAVDGLRGRRLRQCPVRELLRDTRVRAPGPAPVPEPE